MTFVLRNENTKVSVGRMCDQRVEKHVLCLFRNLYTVCMWAADVHVRNKDENGYTLEACPKQDMTWVYAF